MDITYCADCGDPSAGLRCSACQRRHNDILRAEHKVMLRALFRSSGRQPVRRPALRAPDRASTSTDAAG